MLPNVEINIVTHGLRWLFNGEQGHCPECRSEQIQLKSFTEADEDGCATGIFACANCGCEFTVRRTDCAAKMARASALAAR